MKLFDKSSVRYIPNKINVGEIKTMIGTLHNGEKINIVGYDLNLGRFDDTNGITRLTKDFERFELSSDELEEIILLINKHDTE